MLIKILAFVFYICHNITSIRLTIISIGQVLLILLLPTLYFVFYYYILLYYSSGVTLPFLPIINTTADDI